MKEIKKELCARYCGPRTDCKDAWGVRSVLRGPTAIFVTATEAGSDEDCEAAGRVTKVLIDHFTRRPSIEDKAVRYIARQCSNALFPPGDTEALCCCDLGAVLIVDGSVRYFLSGNARIWYFADGKLDHSSGTAAHPLLGERFTYTPELLPPFPLREGNNGFLIASPRLGALVTDQELEEALTASDSAEEWMRKILECAGEDAQFCATAVFLPPSKRRWIPRLLLGKARRKDHGF